MRLTRKAARSMANKEKKMKHFSIGQVARQVKLGVETVRYYEREGLIEEPARKKSGYRQYTDQVIGRLMFIKRARALGFSLADIKGFLSLSTSSAVTCGEVKEKAEALILEIAEKIRYLERMQGALGEVVATCEQSSPLGPCPFLEALEN